MPLDHGLLNLPLSKRQGNIDAQIDRWKRDQAREAAADRKTRSAQTAADRIAAKAKLHSACPDKFAALAGRLGVSVPALRKRLTSDAHWDPKLVLGLDIDA